MHRASADLEVLGNCKWLMCAAFPCFCPCLPGLPLHPLARLALPCRLLATVPEADLKQAQQVVDTIRSMDEEASAAELQERAASLDKLL